MINKKEIGSPFYFVQLNGWVYLNTKIYYLMNCYYST